MTFETCEPRHRCQPQPGTSMHTPAPPDQRACRPTATSTDHPVAANLRGGRTRPCRTDAQFQPSITAHATPTTSALRCPAAATHGHPPHHNHNLHDDDAPLPVPSHYTFISDSLLADIQNSLACPVRIACAYAYHRRAPGGDDGHTH